MYIVKNEYQKRIYSHIIKKKQNTKMEKVKKFTDFVNEKKASAKQLAARAKFKEMIKAKSKKKDKKEDKKEDK